MIVIPESFSLGGRTWQVKEVPGLATDSGDALYGEADGDNAVISLRAGLSEELAQHTFYHELMHAICYTLGWPKLNKREHDIDALGGMMYQYLATKRGRAR